MEDWKKLDEGRLEARENLYQESDKEVQHNSTHYNSYYK